jgi:uncharacterized protein (TIGR03435 family)
MVAPLRGAIRASAALLALGAFSSAAVADSSRDEPAPPLSVEHLLNAPEGASADWARLKGKVVVVEFWATWCAPCIASIPHLNELAERFKGKEVVFISLTDEPRDVVEPFLKRKPIKGWVALDTDHAASDAYHVSSIPYTVIVGRDGRIKGKTHPDALTADVIEKALRGDSLGLDPRDESDAPAVGATEPARLARPAYSSPFAPGRLPAVGSEKDVLPDPLMQVIVRPALNPEGGSSGGSGPNRQTWINSDPETVVRSAYGRIYEVLSSRVDLKVALPRQRLDVAIWAPPGDSQPLRKLVEAAIGGAFGLSARTEDREVAVLLLKAAEPGVPKLTPSVSTGGFMCRTKQEQGRTVATFINQKPSGLAEMLESQLNIPVLDETGLTKGYDFELVLPKKVEDASESLRSLSLQLVPGRRRLSFVVIEKATKGLR